ncbi:MAG TPA: hypothetical protein VGB63_16300, partial [Pedobacter sp.]
YSQVMVPVPEQVVTRTELTTSPVSLAGLGVVFSPASAFWTKAMMKTSRTNRKKVGTRNFKWFHLM